MQDPHRTQTPLEYIPYMNNSQVTQITYTALYKHVELLCDTPLHMCLYMTSSHILPPHTCKCYQYYFPSTQIHSYHSMSSLVQYYTNVLLKNFKRTTFSALLCRHNWQCITQASWHTQSRHTPNPPSNPKCTEPYYTKPVEPIEKWGGPLPLMDPKCTEPYYTKLV